LPLTFYHWLGKSSDESQEARTDSFAAEPWVDVRVEFVGPWSLERASELLLGKFDLRGRV